MQCTLITTDFIKYTPEFNSDTAKYFDKSPFQLYERGQVYTCDCKTDSRFTNCTQFNQHINTKVHKQYLKFYDTYTSINKEKDKEIVRLKADNEKKKLLNMRLYKAINTLEENKKNIEIQNKNLKKNIEQITEEKKTYQNQNIEFTNTINTLEEKITKTTKQNTIKTKKNKKLEKENEDLKLKIQEQQKLIIEYTQFTYKSGDFDDTEEFQDCYPK
tara:strand:- start:19 stop:666 length:648 start_codon:yes stop_codon:yes gene_type:complete